MFLFVVHIAQEANFAGAIGRLAGVNQGLQLTTQFTFANDEKLHIWQGGPLPE